MIRNIFSLIAVLLLSAGCASISHVPFGAGEFDPLPHCDQLVFDGRVPYAAGRSTGLELAPEMDPETVTALVEHLHGVVQTVLAEEQLGPGNAPLLAALILEPIEDPSPELASGIYLLVTVALTEVEVPGLGEYDLAPVQWAIHGLANGLAFAVSA